MPRKSIVVVDVIWEFRMSKQIQKQIQIQNSKQIQKHIQIQLMCQKNKIDSTIVTRNG